MDLLETNHQSLGLALARSTWQPIPASQKSETVLVLNIEIPCMDKGAGHNGAVGD